jgi:hypothetical protein
MELSDNMNKVALPVIVLSIALGVAPFVADQVLVNEEEQFSQNMTANVVSGEVTSNGTQVGVNPGQNLDFGEIETGIRVTKYLNYDSGEERRVVTVNLGGNISDKINTTERKFIEGEERIPVAFMSNETGFYSGEFSLKTLTPEGRIGERWLELKSRFY